MQFTLHRTARDGYETYRAPTPRAYGKRRYVTIIGHPVTRDWYATGWTGYCRRFETLAAAMDWLRTTPSA